MSDSPDLLGNRGLGDVVRQLRRPELPAETGWIEPGGTNAETGGEFSPPFENNWNHSPDPNPNTGFYLSKNGEVRFRGELKTGIMGSTVFVMPEGYRPKVRQHFLCGLTDGTYINMDSVRYRAEHTEES